MANRKNTFLVKRSNIPNKIPLPNDLLLGELALNTADVKLYTSGTTSNSIVQIGWDRISRTGDTMTGTLILPTISATTYQNLPIDVQVTGGTYNNINNTLTLNNNTGGTFSIYINNVSGLTVNGNIVITGNTNTQTLSSDTVTANTLTLKSLTTASTPTTGATLYIDDYGNRKLIGQRSSLNTKINYQPALFNNKVSVWMPPGNSVTIPGVFGMAALTSTGTVTLRNVATTNLFKRTKRISTVSANRAGSVCGYRNTVAQYTVGTGTEGVGGFYYVSRFGCSDAITIGRQFIGLRSSTAAPTDIEPSTLTNVIGVGCRSSDSNLHIFYGGSTPQTPIDLGVNFPSDTNSTDLYELVLYSPSTNNSQIWYQVTRINTGHISTGILSGVVGVAIPLSTTLLTNNDYRSNGGVAGTVSLDFISIYIETEN